MYQVKSRFGDSDEKFNSVSEAYDYIKYRSSAPVYKSLLTIESMIESKNPVRVFTRGIEFFDIVKLD